MPTTFIHPPPPTRSGVPSTSALPQLLQTPGGLAILELQGSINTPAVSSSSSSSSTTAYPVGTLVFPHYDPNLSPDDTSWHKRVYLYVGKHQRMTGEVKKLAKPMAVLRRRVDATAADAEDLEVAEVVYYKLLFASRPEPVGGESG